MLQEYFTADIPFINALFAQFVDHFGFGGNGGMVGPRHPAGIFARHTGPAD